MTTNEPDREAERRQAIDAIRSDLGYTRETIGPVTVEHGPGGSYVVAAPEPPTDLRDSIAGWLTTFGLDPDEIEAKVVAAYRARTAKVAAETAWDAGGGE